MKPSYLRVDLGIALLYALFGCLWILISDRLLAMMVNDPATLTNAQTYKGWAFVLSSSLLILLLLRRYLRIRDIAEGKLRTSEARYRQLFENSLDAILLGTLDGTIYAANPAACRMFDRSEQEIIRSGREGVLDTTDPQLKAALDELVRYGNFRGELTFQRKDGSRFPGEISSTMYEVVEGKGRGTTMFIRDITQRKQVETKLAESERKYRHLVETSHDLIWSIDEEERITYINSASTHIYGYLPEVMIGKLWTEFAWDWSLEDAKRNSQQVKATGGKVLGFISEMRHREGHKVILRANAIQLFDEHGSYQGAMGTSTDITEFVQIEQDIRHSREQLRALTNYLQTAIEDERTHLSRELHDEFGQLLTGLKMDLSWLARNSSGDLRVADRLNAMGELVDQAIVVTRRISSELRPGLLDDLGLCPALEWLADEFSRRSEITCSITLPPVEPDVDPALKTTLFRIFQECLTNISRHAQATRVDSALLISDNELRLEINDDGRGISEREVHNTRSLGLLGMKERAAQWRGGIEIAGTEGQGTKVNVKVPLPAIRRVEGLV